MIKDAYKIIEDAIKNVLPDESVKRVIREEKLQGSFRLIAIGKAAWTMANAAHEILSDEIIDGIVITKYGHSMGDISGFEIFEAGHPILDEQSLTATKRVLEYVRSIPENEKILFLVSGGGSALFEYPEDGVKIGDIKDITNQLLKSGANIKEMNTIRKRLSAVKGGKFSEICAGKEIISIILSDVIGDNLDVIASGPAYPDQSTTGEAIAIVEKYGLKVSDSVWDILQRETPKKVINAKHFLAGNVHELCKSAAATASDLGYTPYILSNTIECEAREAGRLLASIAKDVRNGKSSLKVPCAVILGGETTVHIRGNGKGGRNQELAIAASEGIAETDDVIIFSIGSDGTDGPTDAAGGIVDGTTLKRLSENGISLQLILDDNDSYYALKAVDQLVITGPTGTNVNDLIVALIK